MKNMLEYKNYHAKIEFDEEDMLFVGEVFGIQDSLNFHGTTIEELVENFHQSIDNYLEMCKELGRKPDKEFKGSFNVRIDQELHREAAFAADRNGMTLNQYVEKAIKDAVCKNENGPIYIVTPALSHIPYQKFFTGELIGHYADTKKQYEQRGILS